MATEDVSFSAIGPSNHGFRTAGPLEEGPNVDYGVFVAAKDRGVSAWGANYGVWADSNVVGVSGTGSLGNKSVGVIGSHFRDGPGVAGFSCRNPSTYPNGSLGTGIGVVGASYTGVGVVGLSISKIEISDGGIVIPDENTDADGAGTGVMGASDRGDGVFGQSGNGKGVFGKSENGTGVEGHSTSDGDGVFGQSGNGKGVFGKSENGTGVEGHSTSDRGGVFLSTKRAQINLVPKLRKLPDEGEQGDLIVIKKTKERLVAVAELWFCYRSGTKNKAASWKQVA